MKGADEFCDVFKKAEQIGRLYIVPSDHARGRTFCIYVLPKDEPAIENGGRNAPLNKGSVEVYGPVSGQLGWTETYGWKHLGKWVDDFKVIFSERKALLEKEKKETISENKQRSLDKTNAASSFLEDY